MLRLTRKPSRRLEATNQTYGAILRMHADEQGGVLDPRLLYTNG
eukprot:COSAG02_NODE_298_length_25350_cov_48.266999_11_plen_44_part_00